MHGRDYLYPDPVLPLDQKLMLIATAFREKLDIVASAANGPAGPAKKYASEETSGIPKKHLVAATFALCEPTFGALFGPVRWRSSLSEAKNKNTKQITRRVKTLLGALDPLLWGNFEDWPAVQEFMHDFSVSNHSIPYVTGKDTEPQWNDATKMFELHFAAESEMCGSGPAPRQYAVTRDMVKLCLVQAAVKAVVYRGYPDIAHRNNSTKRQQMLNALVRTIKRFPSEDPEKTRWLFIGLEGDWPAETTPYFHTFKAGDNAEQALTLPAA